MISSLEVGKRLHDCYLIGSSQAEQGQLQAYSDSVRVSPPRYLGVGVVLVES